MTTSVVVFLEGVAATCAWVSGVVFLRYWRETRDALFAFFAAAFWLLGLSWSLLAILHPTRESSPYVYGLRLVAFALIILATVDKNRKSGG